MVVGFVVDGEFVVGFVVDGDTVGDCVDGWSVDDCVVDGWSVDGSVVDGSVVDGSIVVGCVVGGIDVGMKQTELEKYVTQDMEQLKVLLKVIWLEMDPCKLLLKEAHSKASKILFKELTIERLLVPSTICAIPATLSSFGPTPRSVLNEELTLETKEFNWTDEAIPPEKLSLKLRIKTLNVDWHKLTFELSLYFDK